MHVFNESNVFILFHFYGGAMEVLWFFLGVLEHLLAPPSAAHVIQIYIFFSLWILLFWDLLKVTSSIIKFKN